MAKILTFAIFAQVFIAHPVLAEPLEKPIDLGPLLQPILDKSKLPSLAAALVDDDRLKAAGAVGLRKLGDKTPVTIDDKFHLGSCTKPMTATLTAALIEDGILEWDTTISDALKNKMRIHRDFREVTVEQLLAHVGGLKTNCPPNIWRKAFQDQGRIPASEQRLNFVKALLKEKPDYEPNSKTEYSNQGYAVVGVILETLAGKPWEDLLRERVFEPLDMKSAGFRAPGTKDKVDQPWGHQGKKAIEPGPDADNPDAVGPAGTVHASIGDWAKFAHFHLERKPGKVLKKAESFDKLNSTLENSGLHGVGGWIVHDQKQFGGHALQMTGSNTMWYALLWIMPGRGKAILVTTNAAPESAFETCDEVAAELIGFR
ncbi:MAG: serine hydrolase domain-containing protein [Roseibacillus sp.]